MGDIISALNPTDIISTTARWVAPLFNEMLPVALIGLGIIIGGLFVAWLMGAIYDAVKQLFSKKVDKSWHDGTYDYPDD